MGGIKIGDGATIGARALVTKDVPPYSICMGSPAKIVRYLFSPNEIEKLLALKWWDRPFERVKSFAPMFSNIQ